MSWSRAEQVKAERAWFMAAADEVAWKNGGSLISGRRSAEHNATLPGAHPQSLHLDGLAADYVFDTPGQFANAWAVGRSMGLHGYKKPAALVIHWQARPAKRNVAKT